MFIEKCKVAIVYELLGQPTYTGQQKKGYKVICLLFHKTEWHIPFCIL